jgi:hypothetical protein
MTISKIIISPGTKVGELLDAGEILELQTPFTPAPIIDILRAKNFKTYTIVNNNVVLTFVCK